jgi:predicted N-formylglutamate amidohydrolase
VTRHWQPPAGLRLLVTCEHASCAVPATLRQLGLPAPVLRSHRGWDPGALGIAKTIARALGVPPMAGGWSRLVADLNRSAAHPRVIAARVDGRPVPGNQLTAAEREARLRQYWQPWRRRLERQAIVASRRGPLLHLSVHSFVERLGGVERANDIGLLCDPARAAEVALCRDLAVALRMAELRVRRNFPYFGDTDGVTTWLRALLPRSRYLGIEIECNQRLARTAAGERRLARALTQALTGLLGD